MLVKTAIISESLIDALSELCSDEHALQKATSITLQTGILLKYTQRAIPDFTDHGELHTLNVINNLHQIITGYDYPFTIEDRLLLGVAAIVHDLGCISNRENHAETSVQILETDILRNIKDILSHESFRYLKIIVLSHSSSYDLENLFRYSDLRLVLLCCIFRIADECDHSSERVSELVFDIYKELDLLDSEQEAIWSEHLEIEKITIDTTVITIHVDEEGRSIPWIMKLEEEVSKVNSALEHYNLPLFSIEIKEIPPLHL